MSIKINKADKFLITAIIIYGMTTPWSIAYIDIALSWVIFQLITNGIWINAGAGVGILLWIGWTLRNKYKVKIPSKPKDNLNARKH